MTHIEPMACAIECYPNYLLIGLKEHPDRPPIYFQQYRDQGLDVERLKSFIHGKCLITFGTGRVDIGVLSGALLGATNRALEQLWTGTGHGKKDPWSGSVQLDTIDLRWVAPSDATLEMYGGRMGCKYMAALPLDAGTIVQDGDIPTIRAHCAKKATIIRELYRRLEPAIRLRESMRGDYGDLRSKSDAQIAEHVMAHELSAVGWMPPARGSRKPRGAYTPGEQFYYRVPDYVGFKTPVLMEILNQYTGRPFTITNKGKVGFEFSSKGLGLDPTQPEAENAPSRKCQFELGGTSYTVGIGGLHSREKSVRHTDEEGVLRAYDAASYYPNIILNNSLSPESIGRRFIEIYRRFVRERLTAKAEQLGTADACLKIVINALFGKYSSPPSCVYSPRLFAQITITGQLTMLMLIEQLALAGIRVVSANTDGLVVKGTTDQGAAMGEVVEEWEFTTSHGLDREEYTSLNSRDVNAYIAVTQAGVKAIGAYRSPRLNISANNSICVEAVKRFLQDGVPIAKTIHDCTDITKFLTMRTVTGGAEKDGVPLGPWVRWYYREGEEGCIRYVSNGNKVANSAGCAPLMDLPDEIPADLDYRSYIHDANNIFASIGYTDGMRLAALIPGTLDDTTP